MDDVRQDLERLLARPVKVAEDAERAAKAAEALADYIRAGDRARSLLTGTDPSEVNHPRGPLAHLTLQDAAERVLQQAGAPLHARELGRRIKAGGWTHKRSKRARPDQIVYQLAARLPRHPDRFQRVAPNTFALTRWGAAVSERQSPRVGVFRGPGGRTADEIGDRPDLAAEAHRWRSSSTQG